MRTLSVRVNKDSGDLWFILSYVLCLCVEPLRFVLESIGISGGLLSLLSLVIVYLPMIIGYLLRQEISLDFFLVLIFAVLSFGVSLLMYPEYKHVMLSDNYSYSAVSQVIAPFGGIMMFLFVRNIKDPEKAEKPFVIAMIVLFCYYTMLVIQSGGVWEEASTGRITVYSMSFSYGMLLPVLTFLTWGSKKKKVFPIILAAIGVMEILIYGSRGALAVLMCYLALYLVWGWTPKKKNRKVLVLVFLFSLMTVLLFGYELIIDLLAELNRFLYSKGYSSRTLNVLTSTVLRSEDRVTTIWPKTIELIINSFGLGLGVYSDHYHIGGFCHNFILEILIDFGIIAGGLLLYYIFKNIFFVLKNCKAGAWQNYFLIIIPFWFVRLMFSSSFWYEGTFWAFIAAAIGFRQYVKSQKETTKSEV